MIRQFELVERVQSYDPDADEDVLNRAYVYGLKKHGTQLRASGDPYFSHPVEVAGILAETMILERNENGQLRFRLAGRRLRQVRLPRLERLPERVRGCGRRHEELVDGREPRG